MNDVTVELNSQTSVARNLVEGVLGDVRWTSSGVGYCYCPGQDAHTNGSHVQNVMVQRDADGVFYCFCFHQNCRQHQNQANAELRSLFRNHGLIQKRVKSAQEKEDELKAKELRRVRWLAKNRVLPTLIKHPVPLEEWINSSPYPVASLEPEQQTRAFLSGLYPRYVPRRVTNLGVYLEIRHLVWAGDLCETGDDFGWNFKSVQDWLEKPSYLGQQVSKCTFVRGPHRTVENISQQVLFTIESDTLKPEEFGAVVNYLRKYTTLRAIVHTGGKSLHASFDFIFNAELNAILEGLGCDRQMLAHSLTTRLPGVERKNKDGTPTGKLQKLLYLDPVYEVVI